MRFSRLVSRFFVLLAGSVCLVYGQDAGNPPEVTVITNDAEAEGVLGGWPPQNFGKGVGRSRIKDILEGSSDSVLRIQDNTVIEKKPDSKSDDKKPEALSDSKGLLFQIRQDAAKEKEPEPKKAEAPSSEPKPVGNSLKPPTFKPRSEMKEEKRPNVVPPAPLVTEAKEKKSSKPETSPVDPPKTPKPFILPAITEPKEPKVSSKLMGDTSISSLTLPSLPDPVDTLTSNPPANRKSPSPRQKKSSYQGYTLGPGDTVSFSAFDRTDLNRTVKIGPDGTVSYLQAIAVNAKGLTIEELRDRVESELQKYRRDFKLIVTPEGLGSKEYTVLGRVRAPGSFVLDRPTTVLEGIARAQGVEVGTIRGSAYGLADFEHSFVARNGKKLDVDLSKLYHEGDLTQNVHLQPSDYLYVASVLRNEFYVLGRVNSPGRVKMPHSMTVTQAITLGGGFTTDAYKMNVLVVRGDLEAPEVHVVNIRDVMRGDALDIQVENRDIIFIARRPFQMIERVVDSAITTYVQTLTAEALNIHYQPLSF